MSRNERIILGVMCVAILSVAANVGRLVVATEALGNVVMDLGELMKAFTEGEVQAEVDDLFEEIVDENLNDLGDL